MSYRKVLKVSGVYSWIQNSSKRKEQKRFERKRRKKMYIKMKRQIQMLDCGREQKEQLLMYLRQLC